MNGLIQASTIKYATRKQTIWTLSSGIASMQFEASTLKFERKYRKK